MIFNQCSHCGANLDPGENCDCVKSAEVKNKVYTTSFFSDIHKKYLELITDDESKYIEIEEKINSDNKVNNQIIEPLKAEGNKIWLKYDELISNALNDFAVEGFINGYLCAIAEMESVKNGYAKYREINK